jgi:hypothetical protein
MNELLLKGNTRRSRSGTKFVLNHSWYCPCNCKTVEVVSLWVSNVKVAVISSNISSRIISIFHQENNPKPASALPYFCYKPDTEINSVATSRIIVSNKRERECVEQQA